MSEGTTDDVVVAMRSPLLSAGLVEVLVAAGIDARIDGRAELRREGDASTWIVDRASAGRAAAAGARVVVLDEGGLVAGDAPVLSFSSSPDDLVAVVRSGRARRWTPPVERDGGSPLDQLSAREREIVQLVIRGGTNQHVAVELGISANTVRTHLQNVMAKLGVGNRRELAAVVGGAP